MCATPAGMKPGLDEPAAAEIFAVVGAPERIVRAEAEAATNAPPAAWLGKVRRSVPADATRPGTLLIAAEEALIDAGVLGTAADGEVAGSSTGRRPSAPSSNFGTCPVGCVDCRDCLVHGAAVSCPDGSHPDTCQEEHCDDNGAAAAGSSRDCAGTPAIGTGIEEENSASIPNCMRLAGYGGYVKSITSGAPCTDCHAPKCMRAKAVSLAA